MLYRKLGNTGFDVSVVGFGTWQIGGGRWNTQSDTESIQLLQQANELGVNIFDVSVVYGQYENQQGYLQSHSQELLGKAFAKRRDHVIYCVKLGQIDEYSHRHDFEPKRMIDQFKHSLRRLQTDFIDICLIHAPSVEDVKNEKAIRILETLQALGYIRCIGYSFEAEPEHLYYAVKQPIDVIMLQYNLLESQCKELIEKARLNGIGILVGGPFKRGYLTGSYRSIEDLSMDDDYWAWNIKLNKDKVIDLLAKTNELLKIYKTPNNLRREALQYILREAGVGSCIIGHRKINEVIENIKAIDKNAHIVEIASKQKLLKGKNHKTKYG